MKNKKSEIIYNKKQGRYTIEDAIEIFKLGKAVLLETEYISYNTKMKFICECGELDCKSLPQFMNSPRCKKCSNLKRKKSKATPFEVVKNEFEKRGYNLITKNYTNTFQNLEYICNCGELLTTNYERLRNGNIPFGCKCKERKKYTKEYLQELLLENGLIYIGHYERENNNYNYTVKFICSCGNISEKSLQKLLKCWVCNACSHKNFIEKISGENNYQWNFNKTNEDRMNDRKYQEYKDWRNKVFERDDYICQCCKVKGGRLNAHHLDGYNWCFEKRNDINNGITLCEDCHLNFHKKFGYGNNTKEQFIEFNEILNNELIKSSVV